MTYASTVLADSPTGYWKLAESSGTSAADSSGNGYHGVYVGTLTLGSSVLADSDTSVDFPGTETGGYVQLPDAFPNPTSLTIEAVIEVAPMTSAGLLVADGYRGKLFSRPASGGYDPYRVGFDPGSGQYGLWGVTAQGNNGAGTDGRSDYPFLDDSARHLVAITLDPTGAVSPYAAYNFEIYVDGLMVEANTYLTAPLVTSLLGPIIGGVNSGIISGSTYGYDPYRFQGKIGHVAFYSSRLSADRLAAHAAALGLPVTLSAPPMLVALTPPAPVVAGIAVSVTTPPMLVVASVPAPTLSNRLAVAVPPMDITVTSPALAPDVPYVIEVPPLLVRVD